MTIESYQKPRCRGITSRYMEIMEKHSDIKKASLDMFFGECGMCDVRHNCIDLAVNYSHYGALLLEAWLEGRNKSQPVFSWLIKAPEKIKKIKGKFSFYIKAKKTELYHRIFDRFIMTCGNCPDRFRCWIDMMVRLTDKGYPVVSSIVMVRANCKRKYDYVIKME